MSEPFEGGQPVGEGTGRHVVDAQPGFLVVANLERLHRNVVHDGCEGVQQHAGVVQCVAVAVQDVGQVADGYGVDDLKVGAEVELVVERLYGDTTEDGSSQDRTIWRWKPVTELGEEADQ